jgi:hypothetical protein
LHKVLLNKGSNKFLKFEKLGTNFGKFSMNFGIMDN